MPRQRFIRATFNVLAAAFALTGPVGARGRADTVVPSGPVLQGTGGDTSSSGSDLQLIDGGQGSLWVSVSGGSTSAGLFRYTGADQLMAVAEVGQVAPGAEGATTFSSLSSNHINATGQFGIYANMTGDSSTSGKPLEIPESHRHLPS